MSSLPCIFPELLTAVDCYLVLRSDETVFGAGRDLRLHPFPSGPWPVILLHLLQHVASAYKSPMDEDLLGGSEKAACANTVSFVYAD